MLQGTSRPWQVPYVFGVKSGFGGLPEEQNWLELTPEVVQESTFGRSRSRRVRQLCRTSTTKVAPFSKASAAMPGPQGCKRLDSTCRLLANMRQ